MSEYGPTIVGAIVGAILAAVGTGLVNYQYSIFTNKEDAEKITTLSSSSAKYKAKFEEANADRLSLKEDNERLSSQNEGLLTDLRTAEIKLSQYPPNLSAAKENINRLTNELNEIKELLAQKNSELEFLKNRQQEFMSAVTILEGNYSTLISSFGDLSQFSTYEEAVKELGEDNVRAKVQAARGALRGFVESQRIFSEEIAPEFNGRIKEIAEIEDSDTSSLFNELRGIISGQKNRSLRLRDALSRGSSEKR